MFTVYTWYPGNASPQTCSKPPLEFSALGKWEQPRLAGLCGFRLHIWLHVYVYIYICIDRCISIVILLRRRMLQWLYKGFGVEMPEPGAP